MQKEDSGMVERGDWKWNLKAKPDKFPLMYPDIYVEDGKILSEYGCEAQVLNLPGRTKGSIGILTAGGDLFCGDLMDNMRKPGLEFFIDDLTAANSSIAKLRSLKVTTVYPGHGKPFPWDRRFLANYR